jgi:hypothetical protein
MMRAAIGKSTSRSYDSAFRSWTTFCGLPTMNLDPFQPNEERLCFYAAWAFSRSPRPLAYSSIKVYLSGIRTSLIHFGFTFPPYSEMPLLERQLIGYRRIRHTVRRTQKPLTPHILNHLSSCLGTTSDDLVMWAALTCGVYGLFRTGELTITSRHEPCLQRSACSLEGPGHFRLHLDASKTDIFRQGADVHIMANGSLSCPVSALTAMLALRPSSLPSDPLFRLSNGRALTRDLLINFMHRLLTRGGINPEGYSGHSMRRGGAQALFDAGISERDIQVYGRWRSWCFRLYFSLTTHSLSSFSRKMSRIGPSVTIFSAAF